MNRTTNSLNFEQIIPMRSNDDSFEEVDSPSAANFTENVGFFATPLRTDENLPIKMRSFSTTANKVEEN